MLRLRNVTKSYKNGDNKRLVLNNVNIDFNKGELVFILGRSGSGKSTLLNLIASLVQVDSGSIFLDDVDITKFKSNMLCNYRNSMIGYIYQDYHLIEYMSLMDNVRLGCTISNKNGDIEKILRKLDLYDKRNYIVNRLSGGEKQRVAIARAIVNNPDIILCDEPTGALDKCNSHIIMKILKEISCDKLVIMVSHDEDLALEYADRILRINDGIVIGDNVGKSSSFGVIRKSKICFRSIMKLAFLNLKLKKVRTLFTSLALSLSFFCLLLVLSLSNSFSHVVEEIEKEIVSIIPISVFNMDYELSDVEIKKSNDKIIYKEDYKYVHKNEINDNYLNYLKNIDEIKYIGYDYDISFPLVSDRYYFVDDKYTRMLPDNSLIDDNYDILYGKGINSIYDVLLKVDSFNNVSSEILNLFDIYSDTNYEDLIGREIRVLVNDDYYVKSGDYYYMRDDFKMLFDNSYITLKIVGIVREKEVIDDNNYFYYHKELVDSVLNINKNSMIVLEQINSDRVLVNNFSDKERLLSYLGYNTLPSNIYIYVDNLANKDIVIDKLDEYNLIYDDIIYEDNFSNTMSVINDVINIISAILIIFSFISIIISSLMIYILTNNRVVEGIREIGIFRCLGARKRDIRKLFNLENIMMGLISSFIGIMFIYLLSGVINYILWMMLDLNNIFNVEFSLVVMCIMFNIIIVLVSGYIPVFRVSNKKIMDCIYNRG